MYAWAHLPNVRVISRERIWRASLTWLALLLLGILVVAQVAISTSFGLNNGRAENHFLTSRLDSSSTWTKFPCRMVRANSATYSGSVSPPRLHTGLSGLWRKRIGLASFSSTRTTKNLDRLPSSRSAQRQGDRFHHPDRLVILRSSERGLRGFRRWNSDTPRVIHAPECAAGWHGYVREQAGHCCRLMSQAGRDAEGVPEGRSGVVVDGDVVSIGKWAGADPIQANTRHRAAIGTRQRRGIRAGRERGCVTGRCKSRTVAARLRSRNQHLDVVV